MINLRCTHVCRRTSNLLGRLCDEGSEQTADTPDGEASKCHSEERDQAEHDLVHADNVSAGFDLCEAIHHVVQHHSHTILRGSYWIVSRKLHNYLPMPMSSAEIAGLLLSRNIFRKIGAQPRHYPHAILHSITMQDTA